MEWCMALDKMKHNGILHVTPVISSLDHLCVGVCGHAWHWTKWGSMVHFNCFPCVWTKCVLAFVVLPGTGQGGIGNAFQLLSVWQSTDQKKVCWCIRHAWNWTRWDRQVHMEDFNCYQCACDLVSQTCALVNVELHGTGQNRSEWSFQWLSVCLRLENTCVGLFGTLKHQTQRGYLHSSLGQAHARLSSARAGYGLVHLHLHGWDSLLVRVLDSWLKGCEFESQQKRRENCLLQI